MSAAATIRAIAARGGAVKSHASITWNSWGQACCVCGEYTSTYYRVPGKRAAEYRCEAHKPSGDTGTPASR